MSWVAHNGESVVRYGTDVAKESTRVSDKNFIVVLWWFRLVLLMRKSVSKAWIFGEEQSVETQIRCLFTTNCLHTLVLVANYAHCVVPWLNHMLCCQKLTSAAPGALCHKTPTSLLGWSSCLKTLERLVLVKMASIFR